MIITRAEIEALSPDNASMKNGLAIFNKTPWVVHKSDRAIWSEIKGSGKNPYLCTMDITSIAFKCTCPSRKFPCKHGLALGIYLAEHGIENIQIADEPIWVKEWIDKRVKKTNEPKEPKKIKTQDEIKQKSESKWDKLSSDIEYVELFLSDAMKGGILDFPNKSYDYWEKHIKTMVDKKIIDINRYFNTLYSIDYSSLFWQEKVIHTLSNLHLLVQAIKNQTKLTPPMKDEIEFLLGWNKTKQELLSDETLSVIEDTWIVVAVIHDTKDGVASQKVYLYGTTHQKWAYILDFSYNGAFSNLYLVDEKFKAKLVFYTTYQPRAIIKLMGQTLQTVGDMRSVESLKDGLSIFKKNIDEFIFLSEQLVLVSNLSLIKNQDAFWLIDNYGNTIEIDGFDDFRYQQSVIESRGLAFDGFVLFKDDGCSLLKIISNEGGML